METTLLAAIMSAICSVESSGNAAAINIHDGGTPSYGYCGVKLATARQMGFKGHVSELWFNKHVNERYATKYFIYQFRRYRSISKAVAAFNAGSVRGEIRNTKYVNKVLGRIRNDE